MKFKCFMNKIKKKRIISHKIRCNPMHPLNGSLSGPYVPVWVTHGALVEHQYTYAQPRSEPFSTTGLLFPSQVPFRNDLEDPVFDGVGLAGSKNRAIIYFISLCCSIPTVVFYYFPFSL